MVHNRMDTHFGVLELLLNFRNKASTNFTHETPKEQLWSHFTRTRHSAANTHQSADLVCAKIANA